MAKKRQNFQLYFQIFDSNSQPLIVLDSLGRIIDINQKASNLLGRNKDQLIGLGILKAGVIGEKKLDRNCQLFSTILKATGHPISVTIHNLDKVLNAQLTTTKLAHQDKKTLIATISPASN